MLSSWGKFTIDGKTKSHTRHAWWQWHKKHLHDNVQEEDNVNLNNRKPIPWSIMVMHITNTIEYQRVVA